MNIHINKQPTDLEDLKSTNVYIGREIIRLEERLADLQTRWKENIEKISSLETEGFKG